MAKILSIEEASEFYNIVLPYLPKERPEEIITFAGKIVDGIVEDNNHGVFLELIKMLTELEDDDLEEKNGVELLELFANGLIDNRVYMMIDYFDKVGFGHDESKS